MEKQPETWEERLKKIVVPLSDWFTQEEELILMQNKIWLKEFNSLKNFIAQEITTARLEAAREAEKKFNEIAEILQEGDIESGLTLADTYAGNI